MKSVIRQFDKVMILTLKSPSISSLLCVVPLHFLSIQGGSVEKSDSDSKSVVASKTRGRNDASFFASLGMWKPRKH